jgi:heat shock protein HslJ
MEKKWIVLSLMTLALGAAACRTSRQTETASSEGGKTVPLTGTYWKLTDLYGEPVQIKSAGAAEPYLMFRAGENSISGNGGCNTFRGTYELKQDCRIRFSGMVLTRKMCPDAGDTEDLLMHAFDRVRSCVPAGDTLILYGEGTEALARFVAVPQ